MRRSRVKWRIENDLSVYLAPFIHYYQFNTSTTQHFNNSTLQQLNTSTTQQSNNSTPQQMKHFIPFILCCFLISPVRSQVVIGLIFGDKLNSPKMETGVHVGVNFSSLTNVNPQKMLSNVCVGLYNQYHFNDKLFLDSRLYAHFSGGATGLDIVAAGYPPESLIDSTGVRRVINYLGLGSGLGYQFSKKFGASVGFLALLRNGVKDVHKTENGDRLVIKDLKFTNPIDCGITANTYYRLGHHSNGLLLGLGFYYGFANVYEKQSIHNLVGQFIVGIPLGKRE